MIPGHQLIRAVLNPQPAPGLAEDIAATARERAPVLWLLGKVQSGKTSIVRAITGDREAEVGNAFQPCTASARIYEFPPAVPVVRFLDTRGLEEPGYDPSADLAVAQGHAHGVIAVVRVMDLEQEALLQALTSIRKAHPDWSITLVQTRIHDAYLDGRDHGPYAAWHDDPTLADLTRALKAQLKLFEDLPGHGILQAVPVDLTTAADGFSEPDYGLSALLDALDEACLQSREGLLRNLTRHARDERHAHIHPHILGYATAALVCDLVPVIGVVTVPTLQGKMLHSIARFYALSWDKQTLKAFLASLGTGTALGISAGFAARQLGKLIPVYGQIAGAAAAGIASGAVTYALGRAACHYLEQRQQGIASPQGVAETFKGALKEAYTLFKQRQAENQPPASELGS